MSYANWLPVEYYLVGDITRSPVDLLLYSATADNTNKEPSVSPAVWTLVPTPGGGVSSLNTLTGNVIIKADNGLNLTPSGQNLFIHGGLLNLECKETTPAAISNGAPTTLNFGAINPNFGGAICVSLSIQIQPQTNNQVDTTFEIIIDGTSVATMVQTTANQKDHFFTVPISAWGQVVAGAPVSIELSAVQNGNPGDITFITSYGFAILC